MKYIMTYLTINEFTAHGHVSYMCNYFEDVNGRRLTRKLDIDSARILMWQLVKQGATRTVVPNPYRTTCSSVAVRLDEFD